MAEDVTVGWLRLQLYAMEAATVRRAQVTDKPAESLDTLRLAPWECGASLAAGSLHDGLRLPALGISWANCVNTRLLLSRRMGAVAPPAAPLHAPPHAPLHAAPPLAPQLALAPHAHWPPGGAPSGAPAGGPAATGADGYTEETVRNLAVCWSPRLPYTSCRFEVHHDGVRGCA